MARPIADIEAEVRALPPADQERLLQPLLQELNGPADADADRLWLEEVQRRSRAFEAGVTKPVPAEDVFNRVRTHLGQ
jgi:putative addiction module component (TIGR02574 family)